MVFVPSHSVKMRELSFAQFVDFFGKECLIFWFLNDKIHNYVKQNIIVNFIIQKLKNKHTSLKKYTNWAKLSSLILTEREETKTRYFALCDEKSKFCFVEKMTMSLIVVFPSRNLRIKVTKSQKLFSVWSHLQNNQQNHCMSTFHSRLKRWFRRFFLRCDQIDTFWALATFKWKFLGRTGLIL